MAQFSNCAKHNKWNEAQKLAYLRNALDKEAAYMLWDYGQDVIGSLSGLMKILETRFRGKAMADKHRIELRNRRRRADETLQSVHSDIRRLAALAYHNVSREMREEVTCDHFLDAIGDSDFVFKIRQRQPADLDSAVRIALQLEVWAKETTRHRDASKSEKGDGRKVQEISTKKTDPAVEALQKEMERRSWSSSSGYQEIQTVVHIQPVATRHTAPSTYSGVPSAPLSSRGPHPASYGNRSSFARPPNGYGMNRNGNFYQAPNPNSGCFNCGDPMHRA